MFIGVGVGKGVGLIPIVGPIGGELMKPKKRKWDRFCYAFDYTKAKKSKSWGFLAWFYPHCFNKNNMFSYSAGLRCETIMSFSSSVLSWGEH
jgi:hypothetical protein